MKKLLFLVLVSIIASACQKDDLTPSWLKLSAFELTTNTTTQGENSHDIVDAWVYMDNKPLGVWELPCELPILDEGEHKFTVYPGIKNNGINSTRVRYPFYNTYEFTLTLVKGETVQHNLVTSYKSELTFLGREDFEDTGIILTPDTQVDTSRLDIITKTDFPSIVKYGEHCGMMTLTSLDTITQVFTNSALDLPQGKVYMELDYMNANTFAVGLISQTATTYTVNDPFIRVNSKEAENLQWKKIYLELTDYVSYLSNPLFFEYYIVGSLDDENSDAKIYFDNIKIVHYN